MALVHEELEHELGLKLMTSERVEGETRDPWRFVSLEMDSFENLTPHELQTLGEWLIAQGKRIGREYKSNGGRKSHNAGVQRCAPSAFADTTGSQSASKNAQNPNKTDAK